MYFTKCIISHFKLDLPYAYILSIDLYILVIHSTYTYIDILNAKWCISIWFLLLLFHIISTFYILIILWCYRIFYILKLAYPFYPYICKKIYILSNSPFISARVHGYTYTHSCMSCFILLSLLGILDFYT